MGSRWETIYMHLPLSPPENPRKETKERQERTRQTNRRDESWCGGGWLGQHISGSEVTRFFWNTGIGQIPLMSKWVERKSQLRSKSREVYGGSVLFCFGVVEGVRLGEWKRKWSQKPGWGQREYVGIAGHVIIRLASFPLLVQLYQFPIGWAYKMSLKNGVTSQSRRGYGPRKRVRGGPFRFWHWAVGHTCLPAPLLGMLKPSLPVSKPHWYPHILLAAQRSRNCSRKRKLNNKHLEKTFHALERFRKGLKQINKVYDKCLQKKLLIY